MRRIVALVVLLLASIGAVPAHAATGDVSTFARPDRLITLAGAADGALLIGSTNAIIRVAPDRASYAVVAGTGQPCEPSCGHDGPATTTTIGVGEMAQDPRTGAIYFVEGWRVRKVQDGQITTVVDRDASYCLVGSEDPCGDGGPAIDAQTEVPRDLGVGPDGSLYILDWKRIRRVTPDGIISTVAKLSDLGAMAVAPDGRVAVIQPREVRILENGVESHLAGEGGPFCLGPPDPCGDDSNAARFYDVTGAAFDAAGNLYVSERENEAVRRITPDGHVTRIAGIWQRCILTDAWPCTEDDPARRGPVDEAERIAVAGNDVFVFTMSLNTARGSRIIRIADGVHASQVAEPRYRFLGSDGGVFDFGWAPFWGSTGAMRLNQPVVGGAATGVTGYWLVASDGGMFSFGSAPFFGSAVGQTASPVVGMAATPDGNGYYVLERNGRVHAFGSAVARGDAQLFNSHAVGIAAASDGSGYWVALDNGNVQAFGAPDRGPASIIRGLKAPIVGITAAGADGFWLFAGDGGVFAFGSAGFYGSTGALRLNQPIVGMVSTVSHHGYWLIAADGGVFSFGDAPFLGSTGSIRLNRPIVASMAN